MNDMIAFIQMLVLAAADAGASISLRDLAPLLTAVSGAFTGFYAAKRTEKADRIQSEQTELSALMQGYANQIAAYSGIVDTLQQEVLRLRTQFDAERATWEVEKAEAARQRAALQEKIAILEEEVARLKASGRS